MIRKWHFSRFTINRVNVPLQDKMLTASLPPLEITPSLIVTIANFKSDTKKGFQKASGSINVVRQKTVKVVDRHVPISLQVKSRLALSEQPSPDCCKS